MRAPVGLIALAALLVAACAQDAQVGAGKGGQPGFAQFSDVPIPTGADIKMDRSFIFGAADAWTGRVVLTNSFNVGSMYDFYKANTPKYGWEEITSVRSAVSVLTYTRGERVLIVQIQGRTLWGSEVGLTVSPRGAPGGVPSSADFAPSGGTPPVGRAPSVPVTRSP
jgi:hypothetical protein